LYSEVESGVVLGFESGVVPGFEVENEPREKGEADEVIILSSTRNIFIYLFFTFHPNKQNIYVTDITNISYIPSTTYIYH